MSFKLKVYITLLIGALMGLAISHSWASRNSSGTMSLVTGNPVVTNTPITSTWANNTLSDIASEITDSLSRSGKGAMSAQFQAIDGTLGSPGISFAQETGTGLRRAGAGNACLTILGADVLCNAAAGPTVTGAFQGPTTFAGTASRGPINLVPLAAPSAPSNGDLWVETTANKVKARINGSTQTLVTTPITRPDMPTVGQQVSSSSGFFSTSSASFVDVTNLTITITTTGRPVFLIVQSDGTAGALSYMSGNTPGVMQLKILRGATDIASYQLDAFNLSVSLPNVMYLDAVGAGTYTYKVQVQADGTHLDSVTKMVLMAYEL